MAVNPDNPLFEIGDKCVDRRSPKERFVIVDRVFDLFDGWIYQRSDNRTWWVSERHLERATEGSKEHEMPAQDV